MNSGYLKIDVVPGTTFRRPFRPAVDDKVTHERTYPDLTDSIFTLRFRDAERIYSTTYSLEVVDGWVMFTLTPEQTSQFRAHRKYYYAIDQTFPSGDIFRVLEGTVYVKPSAVSTLTDSPSEGALWA